TRKHAEQLLALNPKSQAALEGLSASAFAKEAYSEAAGHYSRLTELFPKNYDYWFNLGVAQQRAGEGHDAETAYEKAAALRTDLAAPHINLAVLHNSVGNTPSARESLEKALEIAPEREDLRYHYAVALEQQGDREKAESVYAELAERTPTDENVQFRLGYLRLERGD